MSTTATVIADVRTLLQDPAGAQEVFDDDLITLFIGEAVRRLEGFSWVEAVETVTQNGTNTYDISAVLSYTPTQVTQVLSLYEDLLWEVYGGELLFEDSPAEDFDVRYQYNHADVQTVPGVLVDAVMYYASGRCLQWLTTRGGALRQRYNARAGELVADEVQALGDQYIAEFYALREEFGTSTTVAL